MTSAETDDPGQPGRSPGTRLLRRVVKLTDELLGIDLNLGDEPCALSLAAMAAPSVVELLRRVERLVDVVAAQYPPSHHAGDGDHDPAATTQSGIGDLALVSRGEVSACRQRLEAAVESDTPLRVVATAGEALRRVTSALVHLERLIASHEGAEAPVRVWWDLEIALITRKLYAQLREELDLDHEPVDAELGVRLAVFAARVRELRSRDVYRFLRFEDRLQMRSLLKRVSTWLDSGRGADPAVGRKLWEEAGNLIELMRQISKRPELKEHDRQVISRAWQVLAADGKHLTAVPTYVHEELANLRGLDSELDELLRGAAAPDAWAACLRRLHGAV